ncbi:hypothetical protein Tcan_14729 [Toxocara canis]|uniref:UPAR/Ly6 domain-containing protein n=2 Tax=Toxocara canis TaxID=6265 RepID=A0A0B2UUG6_TOXCA|nr:hypothetical protein Tcan_14729 [Toxocara canis]VDM49695.1 unnamed protein product [Toxocara canis]
MFMNVIISVLILLQLPDPHTAANECYVGNNHIGVTVQACPSNAFECLKFVCNGPVYTMVKECYDPFNPAISINAYERSCVGTGGEYGWYMCTANRCNDAVTQTRIACNNFALLTATIAFLFR